MFQYAFGYSLSKKTGECFRLDISNFQNYNLRKFELDRYNIPKETYSTFNIKPNRENELYKNRYIEHDFSFNKNIYNLKNYGYFQGYWQSELYFKEYRDDLINIFKLGSIDIKTLHYDQQIKNTESISIHIRRGDYVSNKKTNEYHGVCGLDYYRKAISLINKKTRNPHYFIFTDDHIWAQENITFIENISFVELDKKVPDHEEMYLMSRCKHNIIANSSFSWWGAWLNQNPKKIIIAPNRWFMDSTINTNDLIPQAWIRL